MSILRSSISKVFGVSHQAKIWGNCQHNAEVGKNIGKKLKNIVQYDLETSQAGFPQA